MPEIGRYNEFRVKSKNDAGYLVSDGPTDVLLPHHRAPQNIEIGDEIHLFVYLNKDGDLVATSQRPKACVGDFAFLSCVDATDDGAFLSIGIDKDVYVPIREQKRPMEKGGSYVVYVYLDDENNRMLASSRVADFVEEEQIDVEEGDEVSLLIVERTDLGYNAVIDNLYIGLLYHNELFADLQPGDVRKGWIKKVRIGGKIDLSLQPIGYGHILDTKESLLADLKASGGTIELGDKSDPEAIYKRFQISKNAFKKAIGALYKDRIITVSNHEIRLTDTSADSGND